jgi:hypothetical protein
LTNVDGRVVSSWAETAVDLSDTLLLKRREDDDPEVEGRCERSIVASEPKKEWSVDGDYRNEIQTRRSEGFKVDTTSCLELFFSRQCPRDQV